MGKDWGVSTDTPLVLRGRLVTPRGILDDGVVVVDGATIVWVGPADGLPGGWTAPEPSGTTILPGLVDLHCHGGGGASFPDAIDAADAQRAVDEHRRHGTTSLVASLVTAPPEILLQRTAVLAALADAGEIVGIHLEGPFLSAHRCGAQNPADMLDGDPELVRSIAEAARGHLVTMTVAPEVPGADEVVAALVDVGAVPSIGHTDASAEQVDEAVDRGFDLLAAGSNGRLTATHLF